MGFTCGRLRHHAGTVAASPHRLLTTECLQISSVSAVQITSNITLLLFTFVLKFAAFAASPSVFRVIESWHDYQQQHCGGSSKQELVQLLEQIHMQHCTQPFVATVLVESPLAAKCFSALDLRLACICSSTPGSEPGLMSTALEQARCPALARFPSWKQPKRPASAVTKISMEQEVGGCVLVQLASREACIVAAYLGLMPASSCR